MLQVGFHLKFYFCSDTFLIPYSMKFYHRNIIASFFLLIFFVCTSAAQEWPDWRGIHRDGVWNEPGVVKEFTGDTIPLKWSIPCGPGYTGPTVAEGLVYLISFALVGGQTNVLQ